MNLVFISNYMNHHQLYLCDRLNELCGDKFAFIQTEDIEPQRIKLGWHNFFFKDYIYKVNAENKQIEKKIIDSIHFADAIIIGACKDYEKYASLARKEDKIVIRYSERLLKKGLYQLFSLKRRRMMRKIGVGKKDYLLCASGYAPFDFSLFNQYKGRTYKWGYFPRFIDYTQDFFEDIKENTTVEILWVGRFIKWKHPEDFLNALSRIKEYSFHATMIGTGKMDNELRKKAYDLKINDKVTFTGALSPEDVRDYMLKANIFVMTSDYNEGWGAVLNEAMNCGCAIVVSHAVGAAPYLIINNKNAIIYKSRDISMLSMNIKKLLLDSQYRTNLGKNAFLTIKNEWNADVAAENLYKLIESIIIGKICPISETAPCSEAPIIPQWEMYSKMTNKRK